jgi:hypothetical protein
MASSAALAAAATSTAQTCAVSVTSDTARLPETDLANPVLQQFIADAEQMCREQFVPLHELLYPGEPRPEQFTAKLVYLRQEDGIAWASGGEITINVTWFAERPHDIGAIYHELAHVVQAYPDNEANCGWLVEGIADWARYFVFEKRDLAFYAGKPAGSYRDAYTNAARFLDWLRLNKNPAVVIELNSRLKRGVYAPEKDWPELAGSTLEDLWAEYADVVGS